MSYLLPCGQLKVLSELSEKTILQLHVCVIVMVVMGKGFRGWGGYYTLALGNQDQRSQGQVITNLQELE